MYYLFMIEDPSSEILVRKVMDCIQTKYRDVEYDCKSFHGIGGFTPKNTIKETKTGKLLNDLATYMRGFNRSLQGIEAAIIVVVDNDDRDTDLFRAEMEAVSEKNLITVDHVFCIAVEEMEAWLLGDKNAVKTAYPKARMNVLNGYVQDSICGTWETLAEAIVSGGMKRVRKLPYGEVGRMKAEWAEKIGRYMDFDRNTSPSFHFFLNAILERIPENIH